MVPTALQSLRQRREPAVGQFGFGSGGRCGRFSSVHHLL